jgi:hypothetical protein
VGLLSVSRRNHIWRSTQPATLIDAGPDRIIVVEYQEALQRLASKHGKGKALAILSHRLGRAVYFMLKNQVPFEQDRFLRKSA